LKYIHHMPIWAESGACRSLSSGLPYWPRLKLYMKASYVPLLNVQLILSPCRQAVGSPSLSAGKCAARIGWMANGVMPKTSAAMQATSSFQRRIVFQRTSRTASPTAGAASMPAMWLA
jgi:hypothetical protein